MSNPNEITSDRTRRRLSRALKQHVGTSKEWSAQMLADDTGIELRTIRSYLAGDNAPCTHKLLKIFAVLPPSFSTAVLELSGLETKPISPGEACTLELNAGITALAALIGEHMSDGRITPAERAKQAEAVRDLMAICRAFLNIEDSA